MLGAVQQKKLDRCLPTREFAHYLLPYSVSHWQVVDAAVVCMLRGGRERSRWFVQLMSFFSVQGEGEAPAPHLPGAKPPGSHNHGGIGFSDPGYNEDGAAGAGAQAQTYTFHPPLHAPGYGARPGVPPPSGPPPRGPPRPGGPYQGQPPLPQGPPPGGPPLAQGYGPYGPPPGGMMNVNLPGFGGPMGGGDFGGARMMGGGYGPQGQMGGGFGGVGRGYGPPMGGRGRGGSMQPLVPY